MNETEILGANIRKYRHLKGLLQTDLAMRVGLSKDYLSKVEKGRVESISFKRLVSICHALDIQLFQLVMKDSESKFIRLAIDEGNFKALKALLDEIVKRLDDKN